jgi:hypothetical protein
MAVRATSCNLTSGAISKKWYQGREYDPCNEALNLIAILETTKYC